MSFLNTCRVRVCPAHWLLILSLLALALAGCVSPKERFERAQKDAEQGRYAEAAREYVELLEEEPDYPKARRNLLDVAGRAIDNSMADARSAREAGRFVEAVRHLDAVRSLQSACQRVDVDIRLPEGYASLRDRTRTRATDQLMASADEAARAGDWPAAVDAYEQARSYVETSDRRNKIDRRQAEVLMGWADTEMQDGRFHTAYQRAAGVFELLPESHDLAEEAKALRATAVERGTQPVAFLPLWRTDEAASALPDRLLDDLNDVLATRYWSSAPPFIAAADPVQLRRTLRRFDMDDRSLSSDDAAEVGRAADASFVVTGDVVRFTAAEDDVDTDRIAATYTPTGSRRATSGRPDDAGTDTTFVRRTYDLELQATVDARVVDARTGRVLDRATITAEADGEMADGRFSGDWRGLDLSGAQKDLFDPDVLQRQRQAVENRLVDRLAQGVADEVFPDVLDAIP